MEFLPGFKEIGARLGFGKQKSQKQADKALRNARAQMEGLELPNFNPYNPVLSQAESLRPSAINDININPNNRLAQEEQLAALRNIAERGGRSAAGDAELQRITSRGQTQARGAREAILRNAKARGALGSGAALMAQLHNQQAAQNAQNAQDLEVAGQNEQNALAARTGAAGIGRGMEQDDYTRALNRARATDEINAFNAANKQGMALHNAGLQNQAQMYGNQMIQQGHENDYRKRGGVAGSYANMANNYNNEANLNAQTMGNLIGGGAKMGAAYLGAPRAAQGARIPGNADYPGDDYRNDKVPFVGSPGEVVVPRSLVQHGSPEEVYNFVKNPPDPTTDHLNSGARLKRGMGQVDHFLEESPNPVVAAPQPSQEDQIVNMLQQEYQDAKAREQQSREDALRSYYAANIGQGLEQMLTAHAVARGAKPVDGSFYKRLIRQPEKMDRSARDEMLKLHSSGLTRRHAASMAEANRASQDARAKATNESREKAAGIRANKAKESAAKIKAEAKAGGTSNQRAKALMDVHQKMVTPRGNNAVQRAMIDRRAGKKIQALFDQYKYDFNQMPQLDVNLASQEIASLAGGGHGSDKSRDAVTAHSLRSAWQEFMGKVKNKPTPSQLGEFLKAKKHYVDELTKIADDDIKQYHRDTFNQVKQLSPNEQELAPFKETFPHLFPEFRPGEVRVGPDGKEYQRDDQGRWFPVGGSMNPSMTIME